MTRDTWTPQQRLLALMRLPWTVRVERDEADGSWVAQVAEVPDAIATGRSMKELARDLWESLTASLEIRLEHGDAVPLPHGSALPWRGHPSPSVVAFREVQITQPTGPLVIHPSATAAA